MKCHACHEALRKCHVLSWSAAPPVRSPSARIPHAVPPSRSAPFRSRRRPGRGGTLFRAYRARPCAGVRARLCAGAVRAPDCPRAPVCARRAAGALPSPAPPGPVSRQREKEEPAPRTPLPHAPFYHNFPIVKPELRIISCSPNESRLSTGARTPPAASRREDGAGAVTFFARNCKRAAPGRRTCPEARLEPRRKPPTLSGAIRHPERASIHAGLEMGQQPGGAAAQSGGGRTRPEGRRPPGDRVRYTRAPRRCEGRKQAAGHGADARAPCLFPTTTPSTGMKPTPGDSVPQQS